MGKNGGSDHADPLIATVRGGIDGSRTFSAQVTAPDAVGCAEFG